MTFPLTPSREDGIVSGLVWRELEKEQKRVNLEHEVIWKRC